VPDGRLSACAPAVMAEGSRPPASCLLAPPLSLICDAAVPSLAACSARRSNRGARRCRRRACRWPACPAPGLRRHRPCRELESRAERLCRRRARLHEHEGTREREGPLRVMPTSFSPHRVAFEWQRAWARTLSPSAVGLPARCRVLGAAHAHSRRHGTKHSTRLTPASPRHSFSLERPCRSSAPRETRPRCLPADAALTRDGLGRSEKTRAACPHALRRSFARVGSTARETRPSLSTPAERRGRAARGGTASAVRASVPHPGAVSSLGRPRLTFGAPMRMASAQVTQGAKSAAPSSYSVLGGLTEWKGKQRGEQPEAQ
jgi:hypothetical protein